MLPRAGVGGSPASTATYFVPSVSYAIRGHSRDALLRARRKRPRSSRAAEQRDELAPVHSITSSARARSIGSEGVRPVPTLLYAMAGRQARQRCQAVRRKQRLARTSPRVISVCLLGRLFATRPLNRIPVRPLYLFGLFLFLFLKPVLLRFAGIFRSK